MKLVMQPAISLDGFIAKKDGDSYSWVSQADEARYTAAVEKCGNLIVGRTTYEEYKSDFDAYENVRIFVCTHKVLDDAKPDGNVHAVSGTATEIIDSIEAEFGVTEMIVCGGGEINGLFAISGLVTDIVISIHEAVLGEGIPLFGSYQPQFNLELISTNHDIKGVVQNRYKVLR